jgi:hypothetical protein
LSWAWLEVRVSSARSRRRELPDGSGAAGALPIAVGEILPLVRAGLDMIFDRLGVAGVPPVP